MPRRCAKEFPVQKSPQVLLSVYGPRLRTLHDLIMDLVSTTLSSTQHQGLISWRLIRSDDPPEFLELLLKSFAVISENAPAAGVFPLDNRWTQKQVVERVIQLEFRQSDRPSHVLCFGYQRLRPTCLRSDNVPAPQGLQSTCRNTIVDLVCSHIWSTLLSRVGDMLMLYLLSHGSIFVPLPNSCFLQVCGHSVSMHIRSNHLKYKASGKKQRFSQKLKESKGSDWSDTEINKGILKHLAMEGRKGRRQEKESAKEISLQDKVDQTSKQESASKKFVDSKMSLKRKHGPGQGECSNSDSKRRIRRQDPSSRTIRTLKGTLSDADNLVIGLFDDRMDYDAVTQTFSSSGDSYSLKQQHVGRSNLLPMEFAKVESDTSHSMQFQQCPGYALGLMTQAHSQRRRVRAFSWQRRKQQKLVSSSNSEERQSIVTTGKEDKTSNSHNAQTFGKLNGNKMVVERGCIFYRSRFSSKPGLPTDHILLVTMPTTDGAVKLYDSIFRSSKMAAASLPLEAKDYSHPTELRHATKVLPLLKKLIKNARNCRYACLLNRHCPIPSTFPVSEPSSIDFVKDAYNNDMLFDDGYATQDDVSTSSTDSNLGTHIHSIDEVKVNDTYDTQADSSKHDELMQAIETRYEKFDARIEAFSSKIGESTAAEPAVSVPSPLSNLLSAYNNHQQVESFLWAVCRSILPEQLLGSCRNWRILRSSIASFVRLRRYEEFSLSKCLHKMRLSELTWLRSDFDDHAVSQRRLINWLFWLFTNLIVPLISLHFYVTESENGRLNLVYYRKPVWAKVQSVAFSEHDRTIYRKLEAESIFPLLQNRVLGFSKVRLVPKKRGVRVIANLGCPSFLMRKSGMKNMVRSNMGVGNDMALLKTEQMSGSATLRFKAVNTVLSDAHQCLKLEKENNLEDFGASVFGYSDIYAKILPFITSLKDAPRGMPQVFLAVCDVENAFDTVNHEKLCYILNRYMKESQYLVVHYTSVASSLGSLRNLRRRLSVSPKEYENFVKFVKNLTNKCSHTIFTDQVYYYCISRERALAMIEEHIKNNILHIGGQFFHQVTGIAQGSVVSSLLCSLYYGYIEKNYVLPEMQDLLHNHPQEEEHGGKEGKRQANLGNPQKLQINKIFHDQTSIHFGNQTKDMDDATSDISLCDKGSNFSKVNSVLLRQTDDSLLISTSKHEVAIFLDKMHQGFDEFGCHANKHKTKVSFSLQIGNQVIKKNIFQSEDGACFMSWNGLLLNCNTLEIQADYTRYWGDQIKSSLTVLRYNSQGIHLIIKLCQFMRPKCHPLFYDSRINSPATVSLNAYQAFLICAMKFHAYLCCIQTNGGSNSLYQLKAIVRATRYMYDLVKQRMRAAGGVNQNEFSLTQKEMEWLGLSAFSTILLRKPARHAQLLLLLKAKLKLAKFKKLSSTPHLVSALDERRSSMFRHITY